MATGDLLADVARLPPAVAERLLRDWSVWGRTDQQPPPGAWRTWLILAGRGWGKSRTGAEWVRAMATSGRARRIALVARTAADVRDVLVEGESGLLAIHRADERPMWEPSRRRLTWPNGAIATTYSAEEPDQLRGPQHDAAWCLVGETLVTMGDGSQRCLADLRVGDVVATRLGPRAVTAHAMTRRSAPLWSLMTDDGTEILGTEDHPVWADGAFTRLADVRPSAMMLSWHAPSSSTGRSSSSTAATTSATLADNCCIGSCGSTSTAPSRRATSSTTSTRTRPTTAWRTSCSWSVLNTCSIMALAALLWPPPSGGSSTRGTGGTSVSPCNACAACAAVPTKLAAPTVLGAASSAASLRAIAVSRVQRTTRAADVYDIAVDGAREFFANGLLVHNCDELAAWRYPDAWDQLQMGLRLGTDPRVVVTTTPRPTPLVRALALASTTHVTRGRTRDNARNLAPGVVDALAARYGSTRLGRQELDGEILDDAPGALWRLSQFDAARVDAAPDLRRVVVAIDPAVTAHEDSDETGIVVAGIGLDGRVYVLEDLSGTYPAEQWARRAVEAFRRHRADRIVCEVNNGGDLVASVLRAVDRSAPVVQVRATRGKALRAEPVAALYEQGRVSHVGSLSRLEDQCASWDPAGDHRSPDRLDALVWAITDLVIDRAAPLASPPPMLVRSQRREW